MTRKKSNLNLHPEKARKRKRWSADKENKLVNTPSKSPFKKKVKGISITPAMTPNKSVSHSSHHTIISKSPAKKIVFRPRRAGFDSENNVPPGIHVQSSETLDRPNKVLRTNLFDDGSNENQIFNENDFTTIFDDESETDTDVPSIPNSLDDLLCIKKYTESNSTSEVDEMIKLIPTVIAKLREKGIENVFLDFFRSVTEDKCPLDNIAFLLWLDVVRWYRLDNAASMRYSTETKTFWKLGWRLFGGKFIRFMGGFKNTSQIAFGEAFPGNLKPEKSDINFVVPDFCVLRNFSPYGPEAGKPRDPGIHYDVMEKVALALENTSACLSYDGKKIKPGLTKTYGDVDLLGFEDGTSLLQRRQKVKNEIRSITTIAKELKNFEEFGNILDLPDEVKKRASDVLKESLINTSSYAKLCRKVKEKKLYAKAKFIERSGDDWRHGQFVYVISAINAFLYDIDSFQQLYEITIEKLCFYTSLLQGSGHLFGSGKCVFLESCSNYESLPDIESDNTRLIKQRSDRWTEIRKEARISGSTVYAALGFDGLKKQQEHFDKVICNVPEKEKSAVVQSYLDYGIKNEINAISTITGKILPILFPELTLFEEGCICMNFAERTFMVVSPDGSLRIRNEGNVTTDIMGVEIKCPVMRMHDTLPERYLLQCLSEMEALYVSKLLYVCWRPDFTSVFEVEHHEELLRNSLKEAIKLYSGEKPKRPTKLSDAVPELGKEIKKACGSVKYLGEFPSAVNQQSTTRNDTRVTNKEFLQFLSDLTRLITDGYELQREKAAEAVVFLCCDLDRNWSKNPMRWAPVCWFLKGYSLSTDVFRRIVEEVHNHCHEKGIHVPSSPFDGQWHNIAVKDINGDPLTILQLQKYVWKDTEKMQKTKIVKLFGSLNKTVKWWKDNTTKVIEATNGGVRLPALTDRGWRRDKGRSMESNQGDDETPSSQEISQGDIVPDVVLDVTDEACSSIGIHPEVIQQIPADETVLSELSTCSISNLAWGNYVTSLLQENCLDNSDDVSEILPPLLESNENSEESNSNEEINLTLPKEDILSEDDVTAILASLKTDKCANKKGIWDNRSTKFIQDAFLSADNLMKLSDYDLKVIIRYLKAKKLITLKLSATKWEKVSALCDMMGHRVSKEQSVKHSRKKYQVKRLSEYTQAVLSGKNVPKAALNVAHAEFVWPEKLTNWKSQSALSDEVKIEKISYPDYWFYVPEFSKQRKQLEVRCIDSSHLLTRTRRKICKGGIEGLSNQPWLKVASTKKTFLTSVMVEDIIDPMSVPMAVTHFSADVEKVMVDNGDIRAATLCHDVRSWWKAEDEPGISAIDRIRMRACPRVRLLQDIDFGRFPPPASHVKGWPTQLWEALIANIDAKSILYSLSKTGTYNTRAFSSMMGETFFSEVANQDKRGGHGTLTAAEFAQFMDSSIEQMHIRLDNNRSFTYRTSKSTAYNLVGKDDALLDSGKPTPNKNVQLQTIFGDPKHKIQSINLVDHFFDSTERKRVSGKHRQGTVSQKRNAVLKGTIGVRWEKSRVDESKILPSRKMGIPDID